MERRIQLREGMMESIKMIFFSQYLENIGQQMVAEEGVMVTHHVLLPFTGHYWYTGFGVQTNDWDG